MIMRETARIEERDGMREMLREKKRESRELSIVLYVVLSTILIQYMSYSYECIVCGNQTLRLSEQKNNSKRKMCFHKT